MGPLLQIQRQGCIEIVIGRCAIGLRVDLSTCLHRDRHFVTVVGADIEQTPLGVDGGWLPDGVPALSVRIPTVGRHRVGLPKDLPRVCVYRHHTGAKRGALAGVGNREDLLVGGDADIDNVSVDYRPIL